MQKSSIEEASKVHERLQGYNNEIFKNEDEMRSSLTKLCHGDLYVIGRLWIHALRTVLVGAKLSLVPTIHAAAKNEPPEKPPPMKYKDLPIYQSPHYEYKDYVADQKKCPNYDVKLLHQYLYPKVKNYRKSWVDSYAELKEEVEEMKRDANAILCKKKKDFKRIMRCPDNSAFRQAVVAIGTAVGYYIGSGRGIPRRIFFSGLGALATGALCFPTETDEAFRTFSYYVGKLVLTVFNTTCGKNITMRERLPCPEDMPPPPPARGSEKINKCDKN